MREGLWVAREATGSLEAALGRAGHERLSVRARLGKPNSAAAPLLGLRGQVFALRRPAFSRELVLPQGGA